LLFAIVFLQINKSSTNYNTYNPEMATSEQTGQQLYEAMSQMFTNGCSYIVLAGPANDGQTIDIDKGFDSVCDTTKYKEVAYVNCEWEDEAGYSLVEAINSVPNERSGRDYDVIILQDTRLLSDVVSMLSAYYGYGDGSIPIIVAGTTEFLEYSYLSDWVAAYVSEGKITTLANPDLEDYFYHLTERGSAGISGETGIDVHYYKESYYYVPLSRDCIKRISKPGSDAEIIWQDEVAHISNLCVIHDYIFFMDGGDKISAIDLRTNQYACVLSVAANEWIHSGCYYSDGWIYTGLSRRDGTQTTISGIRFKVDNPQAIEYLFEGDMIGIDIENNRIFYQKPDYDTGAFPVYVYHLDTKISEIFDEDPNTYYTPMTVYDGKVYAKACLPVEGWGTYTIDAEGNIQEIPIPAEQLAILNDRIYYSKRDSDCLFSSDMSGNNIFEYIVEYAPIDVCMNMMFHMVPVGDHCLAFLGKDESSLYLYDCNSGEQYRLD